MVNREAEEFLTGEAEKKESRARRRRTAASLEILWKRGFQAHWEQEDLCFVRIIVVATVNRHH